LKKAPVSTIAAASRLTVLIRETFSATANVSGTSTHLGQCALHYQIEVDRVTGAFPDGTATFTAAHESGIFAKGHGQGDRDGNS